MKTTEMVVECRRTHYGPYMLKGTWTDVICCEWARGAFEVPSEAARTWLHASLVPVRGAHKITFTRAAHCSRWEHDWQWGEDRPFDERGVYPAVARRLDRLYILSKGLTKLPRGDKQIVLWVWIEYEEATP